MSDIDGVSLQAFGPLQKLSHNEVAVLAMEATLIVIPAGDTLFKQGDRGTSLYLLVAGHIEVHVEVQGGGSPYHLATVGPGSLLGEVGLLIDVPRTASAVAQTEAELWQISRATFEKAIGEGRRWAGALLLSIARELAKRQRTGIGDLLKLLAELGDRDVARLGPRLDELALLRDRLADEWSF
jgi:CRP-like cAMP-binding protein